MIIVCSKYKLAKSRLVSSIPYPLSKKQQGITLLMLTLLIAVASFSFLFSTLDSNSIKNERDKKTAAALAEAKAALIGFAVSVNLPNSSCAAPNNNCARPGDLPCPDSDDDGDAESSCGNAAGTTGQNTRIGRLPWKTLDIPDLRDGNGDRLWYAVSNNFKNNFRSACIAPGDPGCLNSDTAGNITVRRSDGTVINDSSGGNGAVAVVFSPGPPITRQDGTIQDRGCVGCATNAMNYLDNLSGTDDNASFADGSGTDGFIMGPIKGNEGETLINDQLLAITGDELLPLLEKRVSVEALSCLKDYALNNPGGIDRHPWAANLTSYADVTDLRFGRIPDTAFVRTRNSSQSGLLYLMNQAWPSNCKINSASGWWVNWKELVFYAVAWDKDPSNSFPSAGPSAPPCDDGELNDCLTVVTSSGNKNHQKAVVIVAGKALSGQDRSNTSQLSNYLEGNNAASTSATRNPGGEDAFFEQGSSSSTFNDVVVSY